MRTTKTEVQRLVDRDGVIARRDHPELQTTIAWMKRCGELAAVLPGVYTHPSLAAVPEIRIRAVGWWDHDAVLTGAAAARISFWPKRPVPLVTCAVRSRRPPQPGYGFERRTVSPWLVAEQGRLRFTRPELTALDLAVETDGASLDEVLRAGGATLDLLQEAMAMTADRVGNPERRRLLLESRSTPWSMAERKFHRLLRVAGISGWTANPKLVIEGQELHPDVLFAVEQLVIEIDGRRFHSEPEVFETDRRRQNLFVVHGWCVLRFTVRMIEDDPEAVVATVRAALAMLAPPDP